MNGIENNEIENQVLGRLACYGKIGLLIEDAPDAKLRRPAM